MLSSGSVRFCKTFKDTMRRNKVILLVSLVGLAVLAIGQTPRPTLPPRSLPKIGPGLGSPAARVTRTFSFGGKQYVSVLNGPGPSSSGWNPASPLPVGLAGAEEIARAKLSKFVTDSATWQVSDFHIARFEDRRSGWYFSVTLEPALQVVGGDLPPDSFTVLLDFAGTPGRIFESGSARK